MSQRLWDCCRRLGVYRADETKTLPPFQLPEKRERKRLRNQLLEAVRKNAFSEEEREIATYMGFSLILPEKMDPHKPYLIMERTERYIVDMNAKTGTGSLTRIDNAISRLPLEVEKHVKQLEELDTRKKQVRDAMRQVNDYREEIDYYTELIEELKKKIGE